jgi:hypothetical protein
MVLNISYNIIHSHTFILIVFFFIVFYITYIIFIILVLNNELIFYNICKLNMLISILLFPLGTYFVPLRVF